MEFKKSYYITAIGTPLDSEEMLCEEGLAQQLADQQAKGYEGILIAGSMGAMQLLRDDTYRDLIKSAVTKFDGEIMVGAGDASFGRTRDRIEFINTQPNVDGVAVLVPYFFKPTQQQLVDYYSMLADMSKAPIYIYDLPVITGTKVSLDTCIELAKHPNVAGIKASCDLDFTVQLTSAGLGDSFRIIPAKPDIADWMIANGFKINLDGIWTITSGWSRDVRVAAENGDWAKAKECSDKVMNLRSLFASHGMGVFNVLMNARGIAGDYMGLPFGKLADGQREEILDLPIVKQLIAEDHI